MAVQYQNQINLESSYIQDAGPFIMVSLHDISLALMSTSAGNIVTRYPITKTLCCSVSGLFRIFAQAGRWNGRSDPWTRCQRPEDMLRGHSCWGRGAGPRLAQENIFQGEFGRGDFDSNHMFCGKNPRKCSIWMCYNLQSPTKFRRKFLSFPTIHHSSSIFESQSEEKVVFNHKRKRESFPFPIQLNFLLPDCCEVCDGNARI